MRITTTLAAHFVLLPRVLAAVRLVRTGRTRRATVSSAFFHAALVLLLTAALLGAAEPFQLWDDSVPLPTAAEAPMLQNVRFSRIKQREPEVDGFNWLHGVATARSCLTTGRCGHSAAGSQASTRAPPPRHSCWMKPRTVGGLAALSQPTGSGRWLSR